MNERIKQLAVQAGFLNLDEESIEYFADLLIEEHITLLRKEWYSLNNAPPHEGENSRDIGIRVGRKSEIIVLMEKIRQHFETKD